MKLRWLLVLWVIAGANLLAGCQRSPQFRRDQDFAPADGGSYYSQNPGKPLSQRAEQVGQPKKRVFILNFWNDTPVKQADLGSFAADELRRRLHLSGRMIIPTDMASEVGTEDFVQGDKVRTAQLIREGRKAGVAVIGIGRISKVVFRQRGDDIGILQQKQSIAVVDVELKLFDVAGGREILAVSRSGEASSNALVTMESGNIESPEYRGELMKLALREAMMRVGGDVVKAVEKMTWEGRIAKMSGGKAYVNAGRSSGLVPGDILRVMTPGEDIYDPASGAYLGRAQGQLKGTLEIVDFIGPDGAVAEVHTGGNFQEGDSVQLY